MTLGLSSLAILKFLLMLVCLCVLLCFKDTFTLYQIVNGGKKLVPLDGKGIAWWTDYNIKFRNPSITPLKNAFNGMLKLLSLCCLFCSRHAMMQVMLRGVQCPKMMIAD